MEQRRWINHPSIIQCDQVQAACPESYEGALVDGRFFFLRMRFGQARLGVGDTLDTAHRMAARDDAPILNWPDSPMRGFFYDKEERDNTFGYLLEKVEQNA